MGNGSKSAESGPKYLWLVLAKVLQGILFVIAKHLLFQKAIIGTIYDLGYHTL